MEKEELNEVTDLDFLNNEQLRDRYNIIEKLQEEVWEYDIEMIEAMERQKQKIMTLIYERHNDTN